MTLICKDVCRDCLPSNEYFEYGLWMPADQYRPESDEPIDDISSDDSETPRGPAQPIDTAAQKAKADAAKDQVQKLFQAATNGSSTATCDQAADMLRRMQIAPSQTEIEKFKQKTGNKASVNDVKSWAEELVKSHTSDNAENLISLFKFYDVTNTGILSKTQMTNILKNFGEPLQDSELKAIFAQTGVGDKINYRDFVEKLLRTN